MSFTKQERAAVLKAMELIDSGEQQYTCVALDVAGTHFYPYYQFYNGDNPARIVWALDRDEFAPFTTEQLTEFRNRRLTMLALFLAAGGEL